MKTKIVKISSFWIESTRWHKPEHWEYRGTSQANHRIYENEIYMGENDQQYFDRDAQCWDYMVEYNHFEVPYDESIEINHMAFDHDGSRIANTPEHRYLQIRKEERDAQR